MSRKLTWAFLSLLYPLPVHADPINIASFPPPPDILTALLLEVVVVSVILSCFGLNYRRIFLVWFTLNLISYYCLLIGSLLLLDFFDHTRSHVVTAESIVVIAEAIAIFILCKSAFREACRV
jgi:hypothetical protein